jgi:hypothetical protein
MLLWHFKQPSIGGAAGSGVAAAVGAGAAVFAAGGGVCWALAVVSTDDPVFHITAASRHAKAAIITSLIRTTDLEFAVIVDPFAPAFLKNKFRLRKH